VEPDASFATTHLLRGPEVRAWALRELERLQVSVRSPGAGPALADGGELVADVGATLSPGLYDEVLGDVFLEP
jgi:hypothetical protein